jgi:protein-arginine kinase activator protein McsA
MDKAGIILPVEDNIRTDKADKMARQPEYSEKYQNKSLKELKELLEKAIMQENYEDASHIRDEIKSREA